MDLNPQLPQWQNIGGGTAAAAASPAGRPFGALSPGAGAQNYGGMPRQQQPLLMRLTNLLRGFQQQQQPQQAQPMQQPQSIDPSVAAQGGGFDFSGYKVGPPDMGIGSQS